MAASAASLAAQVRAGAYAQVLTSDAAKPHIARFIDRLYSRESLDYPPGSYTEEGAAVGLAAFNAFLQANVTGPVLSGARRIEAQFGNDLAALRKLCSSSLDVDGVAPYPHIPHIELFCFARHIFAASRPDAREVTVLEELEDGSLVPGPAWVALRIRVWHYKLLTQPILALGSVFNRSAQWSDIPSLEEEVEKSLGAVEDAVLRGGRWAAREQVLFLVEKANVCVMLGQDAKARAALKQAAVTSRFSYVLSGALGKRTRFQEKSTSQLVVLAKSGCRGGSSADETEARDARPQAVPEALPLNDDTLLERLEFTKGTREGDADAGAVPAELRHLSPDAQPQLSPLDQIILLTEATLKDAFSPVDNLTSEEILPFAVRVISDKSTNWQIYTQALLIRSRIEVHRSRTVERGVLQMQSVVDQVIADTNAPPEPGSAPANGSAQDPESGVPSIAVSVPEDERDRSTAAPPPRGKPTSFFPAANDADSAPAHVRLEYVHALSSAPRWHLESELAYSWIGVGSLVSALEIFKRLRLWAEVALCLASSAMAGDEDGRGSGGEERARAVVRWRLFHRTGATDQAGGVSEDGQVDVSDLVVADFQGPELCPLPPNAPRLFCILGELEDDPTHYERAWEVSSHRFARAKKSLGEHYLRRKDLARARDAYREAVGVNRLNPELWNRLGDISLRMGEFSDAAEAFGRAIASAGDLVGGEDARTWSNLGSALYSLYAERVRELKTEREKREQAGDDGRAPAVPAADDEEDADGDAGAGSAGALRGPQKRDPATLLAQSLAAFKRGATIANDNWRIWDNVLTLSARLRPPSVADMVHALRRILQIRSAEEAVDADVLRLLLNEAVLSKPSPADGEPPARGSPEKAVCDLLESAVVPLVTARSELWEIVARERVWRRDYAGAVDASERAWRAAMGGVVGGAGGGASLAPAAARGGDGPSRNWLEDRQAWEAVVDRTDELVSMLENYGAEVAGVGERWRSKARSAVKSVLGKAKDTWEGSEGWDRLRGLLDGLR